MILGRRTDPAGRALIERARQEMVDGDEWLVSSDADDLEMYDILLFALGQLRHGLEIHADQWCAVVLTKHSYYQETDDILVGLAHAYLSLTREQRIV